MERGGGIRCGGVACAVLTLLLLVPASRVSGLSITVNNLECLYEYVFNEGDSVSGSFVVVDHDIFWSSDHPGIDFTFPVMHSSYECFFRMSAYMTAGKFFSAHKTPHHFRKFFSFILSARIVLLCPLENIPVVDSEYDPAPLSKNKMTCIFIKERKTWIISLLKGAGSRLGTDNLAGSFKGLFFYPDAQKMEITSPAGDVIDTLKGTSDGKFDFHAPKSGMYKFCFHNPQFTTESVSFYVHVGHIPSEHDLAKDEHLEPINVKIAKLREAMESITAEQMYFKAREARHRHTNESTRRRVIFYTVGEYLLLALVSTLQVAYIRRLFSKSVAYNRV